MIMEEPFSPVMIKVPSFSILNKRLVCTGSSFGSDVAKGLFNSYVKFLPAPTEMATKPSFEINFSVGFVVLAVKVKVLY